MNRLASSLVVLGLLAATAGAEPPAATGTLPAVGEPLAVNGAPDWPDTFAWMYDNPSFTDATGKVTVFWFCAPKVAACTDDLARIVTLKEDSNRVYVVGFINGSKAQAKKLDPIRESEGVGRGTLAFGRNVGKLFKLMGISGPASIVVDVEGKVALVSTAASPAELDARDAKVKALISAIKNYTATSEGPKVVKANQKFKLGIAVKLASWLHYSKTTPMQFTLTVAKDIKCNATVLRGDQLKIVDRTLTAQVECSGPKGSYEARGQVNFSYEAIAGGAGLGTEGVKWNFQIQP